MTADRFSGSPFMPGHRPEESDDMALVGRIARGDSAAFATFYDRHASQVLGLLFKMLRRRAEAEEMLQEVFLQVWREAERYRPGGSTPRGWIFMLARSRAIDRIRSSSARRRREEATAAPVDPVTPSAVAPAGPERLEERERRRQVANALAELPPEQRTAIEHAFFGGLSHREVAEHLGEPLGTIKSRILLGMRKLRRSLEAS
jgi:RNA polymerase sigma-70 factor (ECF subfamily)